MPKDYRRGHHSNGQGWTPKRRHLWYQGREMPGGPALLCERANCGVIWRPWHEWYPHDEHIEYQKMFSGPRAQGKPEVYIQCPGTGYGAAGWSAGECEIKRPHMGHLFTFGKFEYWCCGPIE
jgi:hypothetical protein